MFRFVFVFAFSSVSVSVSGPVGVCKAAIDAVQRRSARVYAAAAEDPAESADPSSFRQTSDAAQWSTKGSKKREMCTTFGRAWE